VTRLTLLLTLLAVISAGIGLAVGAAPVDWLQMLQAPSNVEPSQWAIVCNIRLPRVVLALVIGATLAQAGAVTQTLFRNPLADPGLIGVSGGAALAAALILTAIGVNTTSAYLPYLLPVAAFIGAAAAAALVVRISRRDGETRLGTLLLAGTAINALVAAAVGALAVTASDGGLRALTLWLFGDLGRANWPEIAVAAPVALLACARMQRQVTTLDALLLGESEAMHLGVAVERCKRRLLLMVVIAVACTVALAGMIGFVGLVVPLGVRLLAGPLHRRVLPASALLGAALLTLADTAARTLNAPVEYPVGTITALLGAPIFLVLLLRQRDAVENV